MKKKLSIFLMSSIIAISCAGCQSEQASDSSNKSDSSLESSISVSEKSTDEESTSEEVILESSVSEEGTIEYLEEYAFNAIDISDKMMSLQSIDLSQPVVYTITTLNELKQFYNKYKTTYSLDEVDSGLTFSQVTDICDKEYFSEYDIIAVIQKHDKKDTIDFDDIYVENSELKITTLRSEPSDTDSAYNCALIRVAKKDRGNAKPVIIISEPNIEFNEDNPEVVTENEEGSNSATAEVIIEEEEIVIDSTSSIQTEA